MYISWIIGISIETKSWWVWLCSWLCSVLMKHHNFRMTAAADEWDQKLHMQRVHLEVRRRPKTKSMTLLGLGKLVSNGRAQHPRPYIWQFEKKYGGRKGKAEITFNYGTGTNPSIFKPSEKKPWQEFRAHLRRTKKTHVFRAVSKVLWVRTRWRHNWVINKKLLPRLHCP